MTCVLPDGVSEHLVRNDYVAWIEQHLDWFTHIRLVRPLVCVWLAKMFDVVLPQRLVQVAARVYMQVPDVGT